MTVESRFKLVFIPSDPMYTLALAAVETVTLYTTLLVRQELVNGHSYFFLQLHPSGFVLLFGPRIFVLWRLIILSILGIQL